MEIKSDDSNELVGLIQIALDNKFPNDTQKRSINRLRDRLNFACPVCGDSEKRSSKKRGNLYFKTNSYKCYNCGFFSSVGRFLYNLKSIELLEDSIPENLMLDTTYEKISKSLYTQNISFVSFELEDLINKYAIDRSKFKDLFSAVEVENTPMENYLKFRSVYQFDKFLYLPNIKQLIVLNVDETSEKILSFQLRKFGKNIQNKYLSYKLQRMYEELRLPIPDDKNFTKLDKFSNYFNIMNINIAAPITYFEGPIDCYLYKNAISLNSVSSQPPFETKNTRYFFDYDDTGLRKLRELLKNRKTVFLWHKFLKDVNVREDKKYNEKIDYNDIVTYCNKHKIKIDLEQYFSNSPMDMFYL